MNADTIMEKIGFAAEILRNSESANQPHHLPERNAHRLALLATDYVAHAMVALYPARQDIANQAELQSAQNSRFRRPDPDVDWKFLTAARHDFAWPCYIVVESDTHRQSYECPRHDAQPHANPCLSCPFVQSSLPDTISLPAAYIDAPSHPFHPEPPLSEPRPQADVASQVTSTLLEAVETTLPAQHHQAVLLAIAQCSYFSLAAAQHARERVTPTSPDLDEVTQRHADLADLVNHRLQAPSAWL